MEKTAVITRTIFKNEWKGQNGSVFYHDVELDNGDKGSVGTKAANPEKLNPGQSLTYTIETTPQGNKIKPVVKNGFTPGGGKPQQDPRIQMISFSMSYTKDLIVGGKVPMTDLEKEFNRVYSLMISKL
jgi:hypothetical protein